jgi:CubicO group peptidase (beta-lactamase class C family)
VLAHLCAVLVVAAVSPEEMAGRWKGDILTPGRPLGVEMTLQVKGGVLGGTLDVPAQNLRGQPLKDLALKDGTLSFSLPGLPGAPRYAGTPAKDEVKGTFSQGGQDLTLDFKRIKPREAVEPALKDLDAFIGQALKDWAMPGLAVAVVKDGETVHLKGYGFRDVEKKLPATPLTLYAIGSTSKAFTTAVMAQLVEEGKLDWDAPVQSYVPGFALQDAHASSRITPRDLVTHVSGLPRHDLVWYNNLSLTREEAVRRLAFLPANKTLRQAWQYNNLMFMAAGYLVEKVTGRSWEQNVKDRFMTPLRMTHSNFSVQESRKDADHAEPYEEREDLLVKVPFRDITTAGPAGSINSCAQDMARWVTLHLQGGAVDGKSLLSASSIADLHAPRAVVPAPADDRDVLLPTYASGWLVDVYRGHRRVHHSGGIDGFTALVTLFPDDGLGIVVLINRGGGSFSGVLVNTLADRVLGLPERDWNKERLEKRARGKGLEKESKENKAFARVMDTKPSRPLDGLAGRYASAGYGPLDVALKDGALVATFNGMRLPMEHWHYDVFRLAKNPQEPDFEGLLLSFTGDTGGDVDAVSVQLEPMTPPIRFERAPDPRLQDPAFLSTLAGEYDLKGKALKVEVRGNTLVLGSPGSGMTELVPLRGLWFTLKGVTMVRIAFVLDAAGKRSVEMKLSDPSGTVTAKRK